MKSKVKRRMISDCKPEELSEPMNLYIYAVHVIKERLPDASHDLMVEFRKKDPKNPFVRGYFNFLERDTLWNRFKRILGVRT